MAIAIRGTPTTGSAIDGGNVTINMPAGVAQGDVVIIGTGIANVGGGTTSSSGWTQISAPADLSNLRASMWRKVMGASPDTTFVLVGTGSATDSATAVAIAFSGVDTTTPEDGVTPVTVSGTTNPNPGSVTPNTTGAVVIVYATGNSVDVTGNSAPTGYSDFTQVSSDDSKDTSSYIAWKGGMTAATPEDPGIFNGGVILAQSYAFTVVLKPLAAVDATTLAWDHDPNASGLPPIRALALTAAVLATTLGIWSPKVADKQFQDGWRSQFSTPPIHLQAKRSVALLGQVTTMPPRVPEKEFQDGWRSRFTDPPIAPPRSIDLRSHITDMPPRVPEKEFRDGWRSQFTDPPKAAARSVGLLGDAAIWPAQAPAAAAVATPTALWHPKWQEPPKAAARSIALNGSVAWAPQVPLVEWTAQFYFSNQIHRYEPSKRSVDLLNGQAWAPQVIAAATATPTELWHTRWQDPPKAAARSVTLLGQVVWPAQVANVEYQDGWRSEFSVPMRRPLRSVDLYNCLDVQGYPAPVAVVTYQDGWRSSFGEPPKAPPRSVDLLGKPIWAARIADVQYQDGWRQAFFEPAAFLQARRSVDLTGNITDMPARVPDVQYQDGWRSEFSRPPAHLQARRSVNLLDGWPWPGYGYFFSGVVPVTTEMWHNRWPEPPKAAARSVALLGQTVWAARVADVQYQDGWRSPFSTPPAHLQPRRSVALLGQPVWPGYGYFFQVTVPVTTEMWHNRWGEPPKKAARSIALLGQPVWPAKVPNVQYQDGWRQAFSTPPVNLRKKRSVDLLTGWHFNPRRPDVEYVNGWFNQWEDPPAYNVDVELYLLDEYGDPIYDEDGELIGLEDPESAYRIPRRALELLWGWKWPAREPPPPPPVPTIGVSFTWDVQAHPSAAGGAKPADTLGTSTQRGASLTKGAKPGDTLNTRTDRGASLTTGVKKPDA